MITNILSMNQGDSLMQGRLMDFEVNDLIISVDDGGTDDISVIDDLDDIIINARLKSGNTKLLVDGMRLSDAFKVSNALGGYAFDPSDTKFVARIPLGNVKVKERDVLEVELQNAGSFTDLDIKVSAVDVEDGPYQVRTYEGQTAGGDNQNFNDVISVLSMDTFTGSVTINDGVNSYQITADEAETVANASFALESYVSEFGLVYADKRKTGRSITAKLPTGNYIIVGRL